MFSYILEENCIEINKVTYDWERLQPNEKHHLKFSNFLVPTVKKKRTVKIPKADISNLKNVSPMIKGGQADDSPEIPPLSPLSPENVSPA